MGWGALMQALWLLIMAIAGVFKPTDSLKLLIICSKAFFGISFAAGWAPMAYVVTSEVSSAHLRDKTFRLGQLTSILTNFVVTFTLPYLLNEPYAALGSKVGFIFGTIA